MNTRVLAALSLLISCLLAAACSRAPSGRAVGPLEYQFRHIYDGPMKSFFVRERGPDNVLRYRTRRVGSTSAPAFAARKERGVLRVFVVGGSVAQLFDESELKAALERALPGRAFELLDCGVSAYDSTRDRLTVEEVLGYEPDLIVLMSGVNEGEMAGDMPVSRSLALKVLARGILRLHPLRAWRLARPHLGGMPTTESLGRDFEENVRAMVRAAKGRGVPMALCALPWNFRDMPPRGGLPLGDKGFFDGWLLFERRDYAGAAEVFRRVLAAPAPRTQPVLPAFAGYYLARSLDRLGRPEEARKEYLASLDRQYPPMPTLNRVLREVSREEGLPLADLEESFVAAAPGGLVGFDFFEDDMHWDRLMDPLVARTLTSALRAAPPVGGKPVLAPAPDWDAREFAKPPPKPNPDPEHVREKAWVMFTIRAWDTSLFRLERVSERLVGMMEVVGRAHPDLLARADGMKEWLRDRLAGNMWDLQAAPNLDRWWPVLLGHIAEVFLRRGEAGQALEFYDGALEGGSAAVSETLAGTLGLRRAVALSSLGRASEARQALEALRPMEARLPEIGYYRAALERGERLAAASRPGGGRKVSAEGLFKEGESLLKETGLRTMERIRLALERKDLPQARRIIDEMTSQGPSAAPASGWLYFAFAAGDRGLKLKCLSLAEEARPTPRERASIARAYAELKEYARAALCVDRLSADDIAGLAPQDRVDLAKVAADAGKKDLVLRLSRGLPLAGLDEGSRLAQARTLLQVKEGRAAFVAVGAGGKGAGRLPAKDWLDLAHAAEAAWEGEVALAAVDRALEASPSESGRLAAAGVALRLRSPKGALLLKGLLAGCPGGIPSRDWVMLSQTILGLGFREEAFACLVCAEKAAGAGPEKHRVVEAHVAMGEPGRAAGLARELVDRPAEGVSARRWLELAYVSRGAGDMDSGLKALEKSANAAPSDGERAEAARLFAELGEPGRAGAAAKLLAEKGPTLGARGWLDLAYAAAAGGDRGGALAALERASAAGPDKEELRQMGFQLQDLKEYAKALEAFNRIQPQDAELLSVRGTLFVLMGRSEEAVRDLEGALSKDPSRLDACLTLGGLLESSGRAKEALALYDRALSVKGAAGAGAPEGLIKLIRSERARLASGGGDSR